MSMRILTDWWIRCRLRKAESIGEGSNGSVYRIMLGKGLEAVLKISKKGDWSTHHREMHMLKRLNGSGGAPICLGTNRTKEGGSPTLLMSYCGRLTFNKLIKEGLHEDKEVLRILCSIGERLAELHALKIVHNDLKMNNVVITDDPRAECPLLKRIHIIDYGLACMVGSNQQFDTPPGLFKWMAPEIRDGKVSTLSSDVYSYGIMISQVLDVLKTSHRKLRYLAVMATLAAPSHRPSLKWILEGFKNHLDYLDAKTEMMDQFLKDNENYICSLTKDLAVPGFVLHFDESENETEVDIQVREMAGDDDDDEDGEEKVGGAEAKEERAEAEPDADIDAAEKEEEAEQQAYHYHLRKRQRY